MNQTLNWDSPSKFIKCPDQACPSYSKGDPQVLNLNLGPLWVEMQNLKQTYGCQGVRVGRDKLGDWDWHVHTTIYKIDN